MTSQGSPLPFGCFPPGHPERRGVVGEGGCERLKLRGRREDVHRAGHIGPGERSLAVGEFAIDADVKRDRQYLLLGQRIERIDAVEGRPKSPAAELFEMVELMGTDVLPAIAAA